MSEDKYIPGQWRCLMCNFQLSSNVLYVNSGTAGPNTKPPEPCPNDGQTMVPVTWEERCMEHSDRLSVEISRNYELVAKVTALEVELSEERQAHERIASLCFAAGGHTDDGTSLSAVRSILNELERVKAACTEMKSDATLALKAIRRGVVCGQGVVDGMVILEGMQSSNPGAPLLAELTRLREVETAAKELLTACRTLDLTQISQKADALEAAKGAK